MDWIVVIYLNRITDWARSLLKNLGFDANPTLLFFSWFECSNRLNLLRAVHAHHILRLESSSLPTTSPQNMRATWNADTRELKIEWKRRGWQINSKIQEISVFTSSYFPTFFSCICIVYIRYIQHGNTYREKNYHPNLIFFYKTAWRRLQEKKSISPSSSST